jgi:hypothetical protein
MAVQWEVSHIVIHFWLTDSHCETRHWRMVGGLVSPNVRHFGVTVSHCDPPGQHPAGKVSHIVIHLEAGHHQLSPNVRHFGVTVSHCDPLERDSVEEVSHFVIHLEAGHHQLSPIVRHFGVAVSHCDPLERDSVEEVSHFVIHLGTGHHQLSPIVRHLKPPTADSNACCPAVNSTPPQRPPPGISGWTCSETPPPASGYPAGSVARSIPRCREPHSATEPSRHAARPAPVGL